MSVRAVGAVCCAAVMILALSAAARDDESEVPVKTVVPADAEAEKKDKVLLITSESLQEANALPTPVPATAPTLTGPEARKLKKQLVDAAGHGPILETALDEKRVTVKQARELLELVPVGRAQVDAAVFLYLRSDPGQFHRTFDLFEPAHLVILGERLAELSAAMAQIHVEVVDDLGTELSDAVITLCGQGPLPAPADLTVPAARHADGCDLKVVVGEIVVHRETFVPQASERVARRVTVERR